MDESQIDRWYGAYFAEYVALGRGDVTDVRRVLSYYAVPFLVSTDDSSQVLADESQIVTMAQRQFDGMRASGFDRSDELTAETTVLNPTCALRRSRISRLRADGTEIARFDATYLITDSVVGRRISALVVHTIS
jgi:uncharacterized NTF2-like protein DUF6841